MDVDLNLPQTPTKESDGTEQARSGQDNIDYDEKLKSRNNEKCDSSDSEDAQSVSSGIDDSNGFQKVRLSVGSAEIPDTELEDSNGFQKVKIEDNEASTPEHDIEEIDEDEDGFQKIKIKEGVVDAAQPDLDEACEVFLPGISFKGGITKESIEANEKIMTTDPCCSKKAASEDSLDQSSDQFTRSPSRDGSVLRHCIDPEPIRNILDEDDDFVTEKDEDELIPKGSKEKQKISLIRKALECIPVDISALRKLAISPGGLVNKNMRQRVWPLLINANTTNITPKPTQEEMEAMTKTYSQVVMDVNRSSSRFPPGIDDHVRMSMKDKLVDLIMRVMLKHHQLKYYQGFHDVCITFLLCMDEDLAFAMVDKLAMGYMREYLDETMERTSLLLNFIYPLVNRCNPELCAHMKKNDLGTIFALSWVITWFSHVLGDIKRILRVFDFFLASHRMMPVYLSAAFVLYREKDVYAAGDEMGYIHKCLSTIPTDLPLESLLQRAGDLYLQYPPTEISRDPMLIRMNRQVYEHFNRVDSRTANRRVVQQTHDRGRLFVKATMWTVTAVVGVAVAVLYHNYIGQNWTLSDIWSSFS